MSTHNVRLGETIAKTFKSFFHDGKVPYVEIPCGNTSVKFYLPRGVPPLQHGSHVRLFFNDEKGTWSIFPARHNSQVPYVDVAFSSGTLDIKNTTASVLFCTTMNDLTFAVYLSNGDLVFSEGNNKSIYRGGKSRTMDMEDYYIEKHVRNHV
jgi:hypothetical protein